ncbi:hypothetical protein CLOM_g14464 [Closterium sp. NIES-68]|nr:hypothetical protein CLOM_g14464 [Closterium sp. NIES-68]GJP59872.1 hypothetical protein CLOP_g15666 [Closterium sp. NIES-67]
MMQGIQVEASSSYNDVIDESPRLRLDHERDFISHELVPPTAASAGVDPSAGPYPSERDHYPSASSDPTSSDSMDDSWADDNFDTRCAPNASPASLVPQLRSDDECVAELATFPALDVKQRHVRVFACLAHRYLQPWMGIPGIQEGLGARGMIAPGLLKAMGKIGGVMSCSGHVRIVKGAIYFRYGGFEFEWYRMRRFVLSILMIQDAIRTYGLSSLSAEFFLNTCDLPASTAGSRANEKAGLPIFSPQGSLGFVDILYPDPVDLSMHYYSEKSAMLPWERKRSKAVFRGAATNFKIRRPYQWRGSPRFRLHRMSDVRPDLLDARIMKLNAAGYRDLLNKDKIVKGKAFNRSQLQSFKYELVVDGGSGTCRTCGVMSSDQLMIKQTSELYQFFGPLLCPFRHYLPTARYFADLFSRVEWARDNDQQAQMINKAANKVASTACTWEGRRLYWAILLIKYSESAMEDSSQVKVPDQLFECKNLPKQQDIEPPHSSLDIKSTPPLWPAYCNSPEEDANQSPCAHFCEGKLAESKWKWLTPDVFKGLKAFHPPK